MIILVVAFLIAMYVLKIFFPQEFIMVIENEQLISIGNYIDSHKWAYYLFGTITSFITYHFYCCAICRKLHLKLWQYLIVLGIIGISVLLDMFSPQFIAVWNIVSMMLLPLLFNGDMKLLPIVYSTHYLAQFLTLQIRNLPTYIQYYNMLFATMLTFECYLWLILFYIIFNLKKEGK